MNKKQIAAVAFASSIFLTGCGSAGSITPSNSATEDCDAEDFRNMEDECGFTQADRDKAKKKKLKPKSSGWTKIKTTTKKK